MFLSAAPSCSSVTAFTVHFGSEICKYFVKGGVLPSLPSLHAWMRQVFAHALPSDATIVLHYRDDQCNRIPVSNQADLAAACHTTEAQVRRVGRLYLSAPGVATPAHWIGPPPLPRDYPMFVRVCLWGATPCEPLFLCLRDVSSFADLLSKFPESADWSSLRLHSCVDGGVHYRIRSDSDLNEFAKNQSRFGGQLIVAYWARPLPTPKHRQRMDHLRVNTRLAALLGEEEEGPRPQCVPASATDDDAADSLTHDSDGEWPDDAEPPEELDWEQWWAAAEKAPAECDRDDDGEYADDGDDAGYETDGCRANAEEDDDDDQAEDSADDCDDGGDYASITDDDANGQGEIDDRVSSDDDDFPTENAFNLSAADLACLKQPGETKAQALKRLTCSKKPLIRELNRRALSSMRAQSVTTATPRQMQKRRQTHLRCSRRQ